MADSEWGPEPVRGGVTLMEVIGNFGLIAVTVCAVTFLVVARPTRTAGATRSAQLQWQQRQVQIGAVVADQQAAEQAAHDAIQAQR